MSSSIFNICSLLEDSNNNNIKDNIKIKDFHPFLTENLNNFKYHHLYQVERFRHFYNDFRPLQPHPRIYLLQQSPLFLFNRWRSPFIEDFNENKNYFNLNNFNKNLIKNEDINKLENEKELNNKNLNKSNNFVEKRTSHPYKNRQRCINKRPRACFTKKQISSLEHRFSEQKYLASTERAIIASQLKMRDAQVKTWFQNRRTKWRRKIDEEESRLKSERK